MKPARTHAPALVLLAVALAVGLAGCSGGVGDGSDSDAGGAPNAAAEAPADLDALEAQDDAAYRSAVDETRAEPVKAEQIDRAVIRKGNVALRAQDVGKAQFEVQKVVDQYDGRVTEEETTTDDEGHPAYTRMVLRIPSAKFAEALDDLKQVPGSEFESANTKEDDVTAKLIDTRTRIAAQRRSIDRISVLFERAVSIRDIMAIEAQLSRRQADLESLERTAAFLTSQTSMSTIVVSIDQIPAKKAAAAKDDDAGFLTGLKAGWGALTTFAVGLATAFGALLPWAVVALVLGFPAYLLLRARRRDKTGRTPSAA